MCEPEQLLQTSREGFPPAEGWVGAESSCKPKEKRSASVLSPWQGIYRVNGVKTRVEKLCQAFENGKELVELSQASPHDISNVLKLYLRQVGGGGVRVGVIPEPGLVPAGRLEWAVLLQTGLAAACW